MEDQLAPVALSLAIVISSLLALMHCMDSLEISGARKTIWGGIVFFVPLLGPIAYALYRCTLHRPRTGAGT